MPPLTKYRITRGFIGDGTFHIEERDPRHWNMWVEVASGIETYERACEILTEWKGFSSWLENCV